jgi:hypothetical protein
MARRKQQTSPRPVDPVNNSQDHECLLLAMRGRSNRAIIKKTQLTPGQISYRLRKFDVSRMDFRNGEGQFAEAVDRATEGIAEKALLKYLRIHVGKG